MKFDTLCKFRYKKNVNQSDGASFSQYYVLNEIKAFLHEFQFIRWNSDAQV